MAGLKTRELAEGASQSETPMNSPLSCKYERIH